VKRIKKDWSKYCKYELLLYFLFHREALDNFDFESVNENGQTIIHVICKEGNKELTIEILQYLESRNHDIISKISKEDNKKWTPIYYAINDSENGFPDIVGIVLL